MKQGLVKFAYFLKLKLDSIELDEQECDKALAWAVRNDATYYDSVYVKASERTGGALLTADDTLYERASKYVQTLHLRDLRSK